MAVATIVDFRNSQILLAEKVQKIEMHKRAKFHTNPSIDWRVTAILQFFKMAAVRHLGFVWDIFQPPTKCTWCLYHCAKFGSINAIVSKIWKFEFFTSGLKTPIHCPKIGVLGNMTY